MCYIVTLKHNPQWKLYTGCNPTHLWLVTVGTYALPTSACLMLRLWNAFYMIDCDGKSAVNIDRKEDR